MSLAYQLLAAGSPWHAAVSLQSLPLSYRPSVTLRVTTLPLLSHTMTQAIGLSAHSKPRIISISLN